MSRSGLTGSAVSALLITVVACSSQPADQGARVQPDGTAGRIATPSAAAGSGSPDASIAGDNPDNPTAPPPSPPAMTAGAGAAAGGGGASGDGCQTGTFCPPQEPDPTDCGKLELKTDVMTVEKPGNVMVVFDRSGSMESDWGGVPKYQAAGNALLAALTPLKDLLTVGGIFFPSPASPDANCPNGCVPTDLANLACCLTSSKMDTCQVNTIDKADQITWGPADTFISALPMKWHLASAGGTPLMTGVQRAADAISAQKFSDPLIVIVMTDGEPNCSTDTQTVLDQIKTWKDAGIATYVVGLPGASAAANVLNSIAAAGGTDQYIDPKDPTELETKLRTVIQSTVKQGFDSCTFHLDPKAEVPDKLHLVITQQGMDLEVPHDWSKDATWTVNSDGTQVDLQGQLCDMAKDGSIEALRFVFGCVTVPPAPPPPDPVLN